MHEMPRLRDILWVEGLLAARPPAAPEQRPRLDADDILRATELELAAVRRARRERAASGGRARAAACERCDERSPAVTVTCCPFCGDQVAVLCGRHADQADRAMGRHLEAEHPALASGASRQEINHG